MFPAERVAGVRGRGSRANITESCVPCLVHGAFALPDLVETSSPAAGTYCANSLNVLTFDYRYKDIAVCLLIDNLTVPTMISIIICFHILQNFKFSRFKKFHKTEHIHITKLDSECLQEDIIVSATNLLKPVVRVRSSPFASRLVPNLTIYLVHPSLH